MVRKNYNIRDKKVVVLVVQDLNAPRLFTSQSVKTNSLIVNASYGFSLIVLTTPFLSDTDPHNQKFFLLRHLLLYPPPKVLLNAPNQELDLNCEGGHR